MLGDGAKGSCALRDARGNVLQLPIASRAMTIETIALLETDIFRAAARGAVAAASRSCDPLVRVGAATFVANELILGWNYIPSSFVAPPNFWTTQSERRLFVTHAELAVCSRLRPFDTSWLVTTRKPCPQCLLSIAAAKIKTVFYLSDADYESDRVAAVYKVCLHFLPPSAILDRSENNRVHNSSENNSITP